MSRNISTNDGRYSLHDQVTATTRRIKLIKYCRTNWKVRTQTKCGTDLLQVVELTDFTQVCRASLLTTCSSLVIIKQAGASNVNVLSHRFDDCKATNLQQTFYLCVLHQSRRETCNLITLQ